MRKTSKTYTVLGYALLCVVAGARLAKTQDVAGTTRPGCAALLANDTSVGTHLGPGRADSARRMRDTAGVRRDTASFGVGGARNGPADVMLLVGLHADQVRFASRPHVRVRLCWGGDTVRVVQRDNLPSPVVPGTTYRNVYIAVELIGRVNAECLADRIGVGNPSPTARPNPSGGAPVGSVSNCAFLGASAGTGATRPRPPSP